MNKAELGSKITKACPEIPNIAAGQRVVAAFLEVMSEEFEKGNDVRLMGFGNFTVKTRPARKARNPQTGDSIDVPEKQVIKFKVSAGLNTRLNA